MASLFYLVPAVTALMAYVLFGERLDAVAVVGMVACARSGAAGQPQPWRERRSQVIERERDPV